MKLPTLRLRALFAAALALFAACSTPGSAPEPLEPPIHVLLLGDSISIGYTNAVRELLGDDAVVVRPTNAKGNPENCQGTNHGTEHLERWLALSPGGAEGWDVIHFNFGLHDLKRVDAETGKNSKDPDDPHQADPERYEAQLDAITARLQETGARLVFATTTPVPEGAGGPYRAPADAVNYNVAALRVMEARGVTVNNLYDFALERLDEIQNERDVHFSKEGSRALAAEVANAVRAAAGLDAR